MIIVIVAKSNEIKISKSSHENYTIDDKKITLTLNNFNSQHKFGVNMAFETMENEFVEVVKVSYRYMVKFINQDVIPTGNNAEITYYDENNKLNHLDIVKKCMVEISFIP